MVGFIYKEREDQIAELEKFNADQVVELDNMKAAMEQAVVDKEQLERSYQACI